MKSPLPHLPPPHQPPPQVSTAVREAIGFWQFSCARIIKNWLCDEPGPPIHLLLGLEAPPTLLSIPRVGGLWPGCLPLPSPLGLEVSSASRPLHSSNLLSLLLLEPQASPSSSSFPVLPTLFPWAARLPPLSGLWPSLHDYLGSFKTCSLHPMEMAESF